MNFIKKMFGIYDITDKALISMLRDISIFSSFDEKKLYELSQKFKLVKYNAGDFILQQGVEYGKIGLLESGELNVWSSYAGSKISFGKVEKGEIFGEMAYFTQSLPMANISCEKNCIVWEAGYDDFSEIMRENPEIFEEIKKIITQRHKDNLKKIELIKMDQQKQLEVEDAQDISTIKVNI